MGNKNINKEEKFHDGVAGSIDPKAVMVDEFFEAYTSPENRFILKKIGDIKGKKILELGCGFGEGSVYLAKKGAKVTAIDISTGMLDMTQRVARRHKVFVSTHQAYSHATPFADNTFDIVYAANLLHHVAIEPTLKEIHRVLRRGGIFAGWDPLHHNPIINIYRHMAKDLRTADEHPIRMGQIKIFKKCFSEITLEMTWFLTLLIFLKFYLYNRISPNKERYWKKILTEHKNIEGLYCALEKKDAWLLRHIPFLKRYCWNIVYLCKK